MANKTSDLPTYSKSVPDVRHASDVPIAETKTVKAEQHTIPDFQSSVNAYAESANNLSAIGASVAQNASNAIASKLGFEQGKNPKGDLLPSFTDFDKQFAESYKAQSAATLSIQGEKLITETNTQLSQQTRLNPALLAKSTAEVQQGLDKIAANAPTDVAVKLKQSFDSSLLSAKQKFENKIFTDGREDQKNNLIKATSIHTANTYEQAVNGNIKAAERENESAKALINNQENNHFITADEARTQRETADQTLINAKGIHAATQADKEGKLEQFEKKLSEGPPEGMTHEQWVTMGGAVNKQMNFIQTLRSQDEALKAQQMQNQIALNPSTISGVDLKAFENSVSKLTYEKVKFSYIQAMKKHSTDTTSQDALLANWGNAEAQANASEKVKNASFNSKVNYMVENSHKTTIPFKSPTPISHEQAQVLAAAGAGGEIPVFTKDLRNKINSANPAYIESAAQQIHSLKEMGAGHALRGLTKEDNALYSMYERLRVKYPNDLVKAAHEATDIIHNQDPAVEQVNQQKWSNYVSKNSSGTPLANWAISKVGLNKNDFGSISMAQVYGTDILKEYEANFITTKGDQDLALQMTKEFVDENYGDTAINGGRQKTLRPVEMVLGFKSHDGVPYIQQDIINQTNKNLLPIKEAYLNKTSNEYWETLPISNKAHGLLNNQYEPIKIKRHMRTIVKGVEHEKTDTYDLVLHGNNFDSYDVAVLTKNGLRNIFQKAPMLGITTYTPNKDEIMNNYNKHNNFNQKVGSFPKSNKKIDVSMGDRP